MHATLITTMELTVRVTGDTDGNAGDVAVFPVGTSKDIAYTLPQTDLEALQQELCESVTNGPAEAIHLVAEQ